MAKEALFFFNEKAEVLGQIALEQLARKRTCGSHLPFLDQKIRGEQQ